MRYLIVLAAAALAAAQVPSLSGTWKLNLARSSWGAKQKPAAITLLIVHNEPVLQYNGMVVDTHGDGRTFEFRATLDGKSYPFAGPYGPGTITFRRIDGNTTASLFRSSDGNVSEQSSTSVSRDGQRLTHRVRLKDPSGELSWTEVYDKR